MKLLASVKVLTSFLPFLTKSENGIFQCDLCTYVLECMYSIEMSDLLCCLHKSIVILLNKNHTNFLIRK